MSIEETATAEKICFMIGPMKNEEQLRWQRRLADEVLKPMLGPMGYEVRTPIIPKSGDIVQQVTALLDRADLVVADLTGNNPSVMYELAIRHCLGLPCVHVRVEGHGHGAKGENDPGAESIAFDVGNHRYVPIDPEDLAKARAELLEMILAETAEGAIGDNPITAFYDQTPVVEVSPGSGLAIGYFYNFVRRMVASLVKDDAFVESVAYTRTRNEQTGEEVTTRKGERLGVTANSLALNIYIPADVDDATTGSMDSLKEKYSFRTVDIRAEGRTISTTITDDGECLIDVPTTLTVVRDFVQIRQSLKRSDLSSVEAKLRINREFARFRRTLDRLLTADHEPEDKIKRFLRGKQVRIRRLSDLEADVKAHMRD
jgi:hypothetical protein